MNAVPLPAAESRRRLLSLVSSLHQLGASSDGTLGFGSNGKWLGCLLMTRQGLVWGLDTHQPELFLDTLVGELERPLSARLARAVRERCRNEPVRLASMLLMSGLLSRDRLRGVFLKYLAQVVSSLARHEGSEQWDASIVEGRSFEFSFSPAEVMIAAEAGGVCSRLRESIRLPSRIAALSQDWLASVDGQSGLNLIVAADENMTPARLESLRRLIDRFHSVVHRDAEPLYWCAGELGSECLWIQRGVCFVASPKPGSCPQEFADVLDRRCRCLDERVAV